MPYLKDWLLLHLQCLRGDRTLTNGTAGLLLAVRTDFYVRDDHTRSYGTPFIFRRRLNLLNLVMQFYYCLPAFYRTVTVSGEFFDI